MNAFKLTLLLFVLMNVLAIAACQPLQDAADPSPGTDGQHLKPVKDSVSEAGK